jgi:hypothetical protein
VGPGALGAVWIMFTNPLTIPINRSPLNYNMGRNVHLLLNSRVLRPSCSALHACALFVCVSFPNLRISHSHVWGQGLRTLTPNIWRPPCSKLKNNLDDATKNKDQPASLTIKRWSFSILHQPKTTTHPNFTSYHRGPSQNARGVSSTQTNRATP